MAEVPVERRFRGSVRLATLHLWRVAKSTDLERCFKEARDLVTLGAARSVGNYEELNAWFVPLRDNEEFLQRTSRIAKDYTTRHQGATGIIVRTIFQQ